MCGYLLIELVSDHEKGQDAGVQLCYPFSRAGTDIPPLSAKPGKCSVTISGCGMSPGSSPLCIFVHTVFQEHLQSCVAAIRRADYHFHAPKGFTGAFHRNLTPTGSEVSRDRGGSGAVGGCGRAGGEFVSESMGASGRFVLSLLWRSLAEGMKKNNRDGWEFQQTRESTWLRVPTNEGFDTWKRERIPADFSHLPPTFCSS